MIVNLTPHAVRIVHENGHTDTYAPSGTVARVDSATREVARFCAIPCHTTVFFGISGLPAAKKGMIYITSALVAQAAWREGRHDVVSPGDLLRDEQGNVYGCRHLVVSPSFKGDGKDGCGDV